MRYLADLCDGATAPPIVVEKHAQSIAEHIRGYAQGLRESTSDDVAQQLADALGQESVGQAFRLACCIWMTSLRLHDAVASIPEMRELGVRNLHELRSASDDIITLSELQDEWRKILDINYKSIFVPALAALNDGLPTLNGAETIDGLMREAEQVISLRLGSSVDFAGELFPKLLDDREETAAHYTLPATAALLAGVAVNRMTVSDWSSTEDVAKLRIADFACGTGTLLRAAYQRIRNRYEASGGDDLWTLHKSMMEQGVTGFDINALASHMTAATMSSFEIGQSDREANIGSIPIRADSTGSLEFLVSETGADAVGQSDVATNGGATLGATDGSFDLVIQNPPYTSPVAVNQGRKVFDVAGITEEERAMAVKRLTGLRRRVRRRGVTMTHGRAGMGADFSALADIKLRRGGVFATVLPQTAAHSKSWADFRSYLEVHYSDMIAIAFTSDSRSMMSADTDMSEMLLIGTKAAAAADPQRRASLLCVNLHRHPISINDANEMVRQIEQIEQSPGNAGDVRFAGRQIGDWFRLRSLVRGSHGSQLGCVIDTLQGLCAACSPATCIIVPRE